MGDFGVLGQLPTVEDVQHRINESFDQLFHYDKHGIPHAIVCTFCDEYITCRENTSYLTIAELKKKRHLFEWASVLSQSEIDGIKGQMRTYVFNDIDNRISNSEWLEGLCLSPRGTIGRKKDHLRSPYGFSCCNRCKTSIKNNCTPFYAIVNKNYVGHPPDCLKELTAVELAFISPVKGYGYCFTWKGGAQKVLKGSMTFMRVEPRKIVQAAVQLECMGLKNHLVVLLNGKMTPFQKKRASQVIRVNKVIKAVEWLCRNNARWKDIDINKYKEEVMNYVPTICDLSSEVASTNENIEKEELFSCYYPDGAVNGRQGGFNDPGDFKSFINDMHSLGYDIQLQVNLQKEFVDGRDGDQLISSCLLQFPYGIGGLQEERIQSDGSMTDEVKLEAFMAHLTLLSQVQFQYPLFLLVAFSLSSKIRLLRKSRLQLRNEYSISALANSLHAIDVANAIRARQAGNRSGGTAASRLLLDAVDGMSRALPHSNEAAKFARSIGESMQHEFGVPSAFLTVTFDDENSIVMQVLSGVMLDVDTEINDMTEEALMNRALQRRELRLKHPGLGSLSFEILFQLVMEHVVGWNMRRKCSTDVPGLFGKCLAVAVAFEEQGRLTVHAHLSIWIENFDSLRSEMFFGDRNKKRDSGALICKYSQHISSTELIGSPRKRDLQKAFDHDACSVTIHERKNPTVLDDQGLRNLRHRLAYKEDGHFASCPHCGQEFTYEHLVSLYSQRVWGIQAENSSADLTSMPKNRMHAMCISFQKRIGATIDGRTKFAVNAAYNSHASMHVSGCFRCQKNAKKSKHVCGSTMDCECRFRMPDRPRKKSRVRLINSEEDNMWFSWNGLKKHQPIVEILPRRQIYDLFQNVSCRAISESKLTCNSNVSVITDGPVGQYQFKYIMKSTQEDDTAAYSMVERSIKSIESRVHKDDKNEAVRLICRAAFAHNKGNVIGASLASYLTRHDSRFYFSHDFQICPLRDLKKALIGSTLPGVLKHGYSGYCYFENQALHYLCRPNVLTNLSPTDFYANYYVVDMSSNKKLKIGEPDMRFISDTGFFKHPSAVAASGNASVCRQGVAERAGASLIKVSQWIFPDTAGFKANILTCDVSEINNTMEQYAESMLLLFHSYRGLMDLQPVVSNGRFPFVMKIRELNVDDDARQANGENKRVFNSRNLSFLQNIQNSAYNSLRYKMSIDDLKSVTHPFSVKVPDMSENPAVAEEEDDDEVPYEVFLDHCDVVDLNDSDARVFGQKLQNYSFRALRNGGMHGCGYSPKIPSIVISRNELLNREWVGYNNSAAMSTTFASRWTVFDKPKLRDVLKLYLRKAVRKSRPEVFKRNNEAKVCEANGSIESILEWANAAGLDAMQKRSFESIVSSFLLTFHNFNENEYNDPTISTGLRTRARNVKKGLMTLLGVAEKVCQLILLLHGPGGSGKSTVIFLVIAYAREYCDLLGHPFTIRTIVVTAMSGVAATLIHGETTHMSMGLNRNSVTPEMIEAWSDTRLVIVDECSFASADQVNKLEKHARHLKNVAFQHYGGLNVVFAGDFSQLEPPCREPLYSSKCKVCPAFHGLLNAFIELDGSHRFRDDSKYGDIMLRFREGKVTKEDVRFINDNCVISSSHFPEGNVPVAVFRNRNRDAINTAMFEQYCKDNKPSNSNDVFGEAIMVFMDSLEMWDSAKTYVRVDSNEVKSYFYFRCGEDACKTGDMTSGRVDPVLKLFPECPLMLTENKDVCNGQANGTRLRLKRVNVKHGEQPMLIMLSCGAKVRAFFASQICSFTVRHEVDDIVPREFDITPKSYSFSAKLLICGDKRTLRMKGYQLPVISNGATTGHKLQGCSLHCLAVFELHYRQNWIYVILSRVHTSKGLFLSGPLSLDLDNYVMSKDMKLMISEFQRTIGLKIFGNEDYTRILQLDQHNRESRGSIFVSMDDVG